MSVQNSNTAALKDFFSNPWVGIFGSIASIVSLGLAVYFYLASLSQPEVVYYVDPARASVVKQGAASRLSVQFDGKPIVEDVTAVQVAVWNKGNKAVHRESLLRPVVFRTKPQVPILEVRLKKRSRDVIQLDLDESKLNSGELALTWNVLEQGDGGYFQLIYAGGADIEILGDGVIEGQPSLKEMRYPKEIKSEKDQMKSERTYLIVGYAYLAFAVVFFIYGISRIIKRRPILQALNFLDLAMPIFTLGMAIYILSGWWTFSSPPFPAE